jgi:hypothetical protein
MTGATAGCRRARHGHETGDDYHLRALGSLPAFLLRLHSPTVPGTVTRPRPVNTARLATLHPRLPSLSSGIRTMSAAAGTAG